MAIAAGATLEDALREMVQSNSRIAHVLGEDGKPIGALTMDALACAMVVPAPHGDGAGA
jgi:CBS domain-containing protein